MRFHSDFRGKNFQKCDFTVIFFVVTQRLPINIFKEQISFAKIAIKLPKKSPILLRLVLNYLNLDKFLAELADFIVFCVKRIVFCKKRTLGPFSFCLSCRFRENPNRFTTGCTRRLICDYYRENLHRKRKLSLLIIEFYYFKQSTYICNHKKGLDTDNFMNWNQICI